MSPSKTSLGKPISAEELRKMNAYWRAANYLAVGQIYLYDNPLLKAPLKLEHIKPRLLGHGHTQKALSFAKSCSAQLTITQLPNRKRRIGAQLVGCADLMAPALIRPSATT